MGHNKISSLKRNTFHGLTQLEKLDLSYNDIQNIDKNSFGHIGKLKCLSIVFSKSIDLKETTFGGLSNLERLNLYPYPKNHINSCIFKSLPKLKELVLFNSNTYFYPNFRANFEISEQNFSLFFLKEFTNSSLKSKFLIMSNSLNLIELEESDWKNIKGRFRWKNIPSKFVALIGLNGTGKTNLLQFIDNSINSADKTFFTIKRSKYFVCKYFDSSNSTIRKSDYKSVKALLQKQFISHLDEFKAFVYENLDDFSAFEYYQYLILAGYELNDLNYYLRINGFKYLFSNQFFYEKRNCFERLNSNLFINYYNVSESNSIENCFENFDMQLKLSPGENLMLIFYLWSFHALKLKEENSGNPIRNKLRIVLLDEPDAHMHPSLIKQFVDLIQENQFEYLNLQVIMSTHSPVTISLIKDPNNIYELENNQNNQLISVKPTKNKQKLIHDVSGNLFYLKEKFKIVFVEGVNDDVEFYQIVFSNYLKTNNLHLSIPIHFQGMGDKNFNQIFRKKKLDPSHKIDEFIFGINDGDYLIREAYEHYNQVYNAEIEYQDNFKRLSRYSFENYLYDPINLIFAINFLLSGKEVAIKNENTDKIKFFNEIIKLLSELKEHQNLGDYLQYTENAKVKSFFDSILNAFASFYENNLDANEKKKFCNKFGPLNKVKKTIKFRYFNKEFDLDYPPVLLYFKGKEMANAINPILELILMKNNCPSEQPDNFSHCPHFNVIKCFYDAKLSEQIETFEIFFKNLTESKKQQIIKDSEATLWNNLNKIENINFILNNVNKNSSDLFKKLRQYCQTYNLLNNIKKYDESTVKNIEELNTIKTYIKKHRLAFDKIIIEKLVELNIVEEENSSDAYSHLKTNLEDFLRNSKISEKERTQTKKILDNLNVLSNNKVINIDITSLKQLNEWLQKRLSQIADETNFHQQNVNSNEFKFLANLLVRRNIFQTDLMQTLMHAYRNTNFLTDESLMQIMENIRR